MHSAYIYYQEFAQVSKEPFSREEISNFYQTGAIAADDAVYLEDERWVSVLEYAQTAPPSIDTIIEGIKNEYKLSDQNAERNSVFEEFIATKQPILAGVLGGGAAGILSYGMLQFLGNARVQELLVGAGVNIVEHWEEIAMAHDLVSFIGWENTARILGITGEVIIDNMGTVSQFIDIAELASESIDALTGAFIGVLVGLAVTKAFDKYNEQQKQEYKDLMERNFKRARFKAMLAQNAPPTQLAQLIQRTEGHALCW